MFDADFVPVIITVSLLLFISAYNDYQDRSYIWEATYLSLSLVLPMLKVDSTNTYAAFTRSIVSVLVLIIVFFSAQKYFVGSDADAAIKDNEVRICASCYCFCY